MSNDVLTADMLKETHAAFGSYLESKLCKCLPTSIDWSPDSSPFERFDAILNRDQSDEAWAAEARAKEEKFGMHVASLTRARDTILVAEERMRTAKPETFGATAGRQAVIDLLYGSYDVLGPYLGTTVRTSAVIPCVPGRCMCRLLTKVAR